MKILVGSNNSTKLDAVKESFKLYFKDKLEVSGRSVDSQVSNQPIGETTFIGAMNRAKALEKINNKEQLLIDYYVGIEGGRIDLNNQSFSSNIVCVINNKGKIGFGISPMFQIPNSISDKLSEGIELGSIINQISDKNKPENKGGAVDYFSKGKISRKEMTKLAIIMALIPFINKEFY